jgi:hypothetical protein
VHWRYGLDLVAVRSSGGLISPSSSSFFAVPVRHVEVWQDARTTCAWQILCHSAMTRAMDADLTVLQTRVHLTRAAE